MGYAITGGTGLLLGVAALIWGLRERSARHAAEREAAAERVSRKAAEVIARQNVDAIEAFKAALVRISTVNKTLTQRLTGARERLVRCQDPQTIKAWLDEELAEDEL